MPRREKPVRMRRIAEPGDVDDRTGLVYEARVTNQDTAEYHGFPVLDRDPLRDEIVRQWRARAR